jgi:hypothetical protein
MLPRHFTTLCQQLGGLLQRLRSGAKANHEGCDLFAQRPALNHLAHLPVEQLPAFVRTCPVAHKYLALLGELPWEQLPQREAKRAWPGCKPQPRTAYVATFLVKGHEGKRSMSKVRTFLVEHPALIWLFGFHLHACPAGTPPPACGFDAERSVPTHKHLSRVLRELPNDALQFLLSATVHLLQDALPAEALPESARFGDAISLDTKHILAWVVENNPKQRIHDRFDKNKQPKGDPDCKLGCKERHRVAVHDGSDETPSQEALPASHVEVGEFYWGYASGVVATKVDGWGEFVLAEMTKPFNEADASYFQPLLAMTEQRLARKPRFGALDKGFDAFYVYAYFHTAGGFAAVPFAERGKARTFDDYGLPLCEAELAMPLKSTFMHNTSLVAHERGRYVCPLLFPQANAASCPIAHAKWESGGCVTTMATSIGARIRYQLDRQGQAFKAVYRQRTASERINSQAVELGIERPKLRNRTSIANQNTLLYLLINLYAWQRVRTQRKERAATPT